MTALVGPSGAGKTTISLLVSRLYDVDAGAVTINGVDVRDATTDSMSATVGVVTQDPHLFHDTLRANLVFAKPGASDAELEAALRAAQIWGLVDLAAARHGDRGGRARATASRAARSSASRWRGCCSRHRTWWCSTRRPRTWTPRASASVQRALDETMSSRTSLVIAHRLSTIRNADQILVVDDGTIVQRGTHEELLAAGGLYRDLYETQFAQQPHQQQARGAGPAAGATPTP